jgi:ferredoxin-like protein FixX
MGVCDIMDFLLHYGKRYKKSIDDIRKTDDEEERRKKKKKLLPAITPAGVFNRDNGDHLVSYSGCLCVDLDHLTNLEEAKDELSSFPGLMYCGLSVSGKGLFLLIKLAKPDKYLDHQRAIWRDLRVLGFEPDLVTSAINRTRFVSYDPYPVVWFNPIPYEKEETGKTESFETKSFERKDTKRQYAGNGFSDADKVERCINQIVSRQLDITANRDDWINIGLALADRFGNSGRVYFHQVSRFYPKYNFRESDNKYNELLMHHKGKITIATFFKICSNWGMRW